MKSTSTMDSPSDKSLTEPMSETLLLGLDGLDMASRQAAIEEAARTAHPSHLVGMIAGDDVVRRNASLVVLTKIGRRSVPALLEALEDPDPDVVMFAASTLGKTREPAVAPHLVRLLKNPNINVAQAAIESLGQLRAATAMDALEEVLSGDPWLRFASVHSLGEIGHPRAVRTLVRLLADIDVRDSAVEALGKIGSPDAVAELAQLLLAAPSPEDFATSLRALGRVLARTPDPEALRSIPGWVALAEEATQVLVPRLLDVLAPRAQEAGATAQAQMRLAAVEFVRVLRLSPCYEALVAASADATLADALLGAAVHLGPAVGPLVVGALGHPEKNVRLFACRAVGAGLFDEGAGLVAALLDDADEEIRAAALTTLARLGSTDYLPAMMARLRDDSPRVEGAAIEALSRLDAGAVSQGILQAPSVAGQHRRKLLQIIRENPDGLQRGFVEASLRDSDPDVRSAAVAILASQPDPDIVASVEGLLADPEVNVRRDVISVLVSYRSQRIRDLLLWQLQHDPEVRVEALRALAKVGNDRVVPQLVAFYPSCSASEKVGIIDTLGALEALCAEPFLISQLRHQDPAVRRHAVAALVRIGTPAALQYVSSCAGDPDARVRLAVADSLASCPHPIAREALERLSLDRESRRRRGRPRPPGQLSHRWLRPAAQGAYRARSVGRISATRSRHRCSCRRHSCDSCARRGSRVMNAQNERPSPSPVPDRNRTGTGCRTRRRSCVLPARVRRHSCRSL